MRLPPAGHPARYLLPAILLLILGALAAIQLPRAGEKLLQLQLQRQGIIIDRCPINRLGPGTISLGPLLLGSPEDPDLTLERATINLRPLEFNLQRLIEELVISGACLEIERSEKGWRFPVLKHLPAISTAEKSRGADQPSRLSRIPDGRLIIERSRLKLKRQERTIEIPLALELEKKSDADATRISGDLRILNNTAWRFSLTAGHGAKARIKISSNGFNPAELFRRLNLPAEIVFSGNLDLEAELELDLKSYSFRLQKGRINWPQGRLELPETGLSLWPADNHKQFLTWEETDAGKWEVGLSPLALRWSPAGILKISSRPLKLSLNEQKGWQIEGRGMIAGPDKYSAFAFYRAGSHEPAWQLQAAYQESESWQAALRLADSDGRWRMSADEDGPAVTGADFAVELTAENGNFKTQGHFAIAALEWADTPLTGAGQLIFQADRQQFRASGDITPLATEKLTFKLNGQKDAALGWQGGFSLAPWHFQELKLPSQLSLEGSFRGTFSGIFSAEGDFKLHNGKATGRLTGNLENGRLTDSEDKFSLEGLSCRLHFPALPRLQSAPAQPLHFSRLGYGNIHCDSGRLELQIEEGGRLFLEKGSLNWCGGHIDIQPLRIEPGRERYQTTLFCDRLALAPLLAQLAGIEARGEGSVNGRIPVDWENGHPRFDDGFLYSTPGRGGSISISRQQQLLAGLPQDSREFAQLDLALEALRDYQYDWTRLSLNSPAETPEELLFKLQFDGRPNRLLPFAYKEEIGGFVRLEAGSEGSRFQGISLDVNLRLPLSRIIRYRNWPEKLQ